MVLDSAFQAGFFKYPVVNNGDKVFFLKQQAKPYCDILKGFQRFSFSTLRCPDVHECHPVRVWCGHWKTTS
jgi:hypothetical protein